MPAAFLDSKLGNLKFTGKDHKTRKRKNNDNQSSETTECFANSKKLATISVTVEQF